MSLAIVPCTLREARAYVAEHHRHHEPPQGGLFALACSDGSQIRGVAIVGRPVARELAADDFAAELTRLCIDRAWREAVEIGTMAGSWFRARELELRGIAHTERVLREMRKAETGASSILYGAAWRSARALGYRRLVTYTLAAEGGASLRAAGWSCIGEAGGGSWSRTSRPRVDTHPLQIKLRWERAEP